MSIHPTPFMGDGSDRAMYKHLGTHPKTQQEAAEEAEWGS